MYNFSNDTIDMSIDREYQFEYVCEVRMFLTCVFILQDIFENSLFRGIYHFSQLCPRVTFDPDAYESKTNDVDVDEWSLYDIRLSKYI